MVISHKNLITDLGTSSSVLESNKADKLSFGTSISNINNTGSIYYSVSKTNDDAEIGKSRQIIYSEMKLYFQVRLIPVHWLQ